MSDEKFPLPKRISKQKLDYAFERSCGITPAQACRAVGGKVENGLATKWEADANVQKAIAHYRALGQTEEMRAHKRSRLEQRLELAAYGDVFEFTTLSDKSPVIDWEKVASSPYSVIIEAFKFDKDTGRLTDFTRDNALQAASQLRAMHGFDAPKKTALTDPSGQNAASIYLIADKPMSEAEWEAQRAGAD